MIDTLNNYTAVLEQALAAAAPMSMRATVLAAVIRLVDRGKSILEVTESGGPPLRALAIMLEVRDLARTQQAWVDALLKDETPDPEIIDLLHFYKANLAVLETTTGMAMAYVGSDREDSEDGAWWSSRAGEVVMEVAALAPQLMALPADKG